MTTDDKFTIIVKVFRNGRLNGDITNSILTRLMLSEFTDIQPTEGNTSNEVSSKHADGIIAFGDI